MESPTPPLGQSCVRVIVVDDDHGIRTLLELTMSLDDRFQLVGSAATAHELHGLLEIHGPSSVDVVLLDVTLPDSDGIDLLALLRERHPGLRLALFTGWSDEATQDRAHAAGADAIFPKDGNAQGLLDGIAELASAR